MLLNYTNRVMTAGMPLPTTVAELIEKLTPAALGSVLGVSAQGISNMKQRGAIPPKHWPAVVALAKQDSDLSAFTVEDLVAIHTISDPHRQREFSKPIHQPKRAGAGA